MRLYPIAIGDSVERALSFFGISQERVERAFGLPPGGCGCSARRDAINAWGIRVQYRIIMFIGGPSYMRPKDRIAFAARRIRGSLSFRSEGRSWKTITSISALIAKNGSGVTRR